MHLSGFFTRCLLALAAMACAKSAYAQTDTIAGSETDRAIEDLILNAEVDEQADFTFITDYLEDLLREPLNLNRAAPDELLRLPGMNDLLVSALLEYVATVGPLTSVYELQAVPGFREETIRQILPYVTVSEGRARDISPGQKHPAGPGLAEVWDGASYELIQRAVWVAEEQRGYTDPDTTLRDILDSEGNVIGQDTSLSTRYLGPQYRNYTRFRARYGQNVSIALTGENDPGEPYRWDPGQGWFGYDFLSGHVAIQGYGRLKKLIVGDYNLQAGQGLAISRGLGFGKGASVISSVKMPNLGLVPYASVNEALLLRGAAATYALGDVHVTGFFSRRRVDASAQQRDTLDDEVLSASGIQLSGLHRTPSEIANRRVTTETLAGGRVEYKTRTLTLGATHYQQQFGSEINPPLNSYNQFDFRGRLNYVSAADADVIYRNFNFFGEVARSRSGGWGGVAGLMGSIAPTVDVSMVFRHFDLDYQTTKAYVFAERPTAAQNETGLYFGLRIAPNPKWEWNSYFDRFRFPWNTYQRDYPSSGWEFMTQLDYKPRRGTLVYLRYRTDHREENASADEYPDGQQLAFLVPQRRDQFRIHFESKLSRDLIYRTRLEFSWFEKGLEQHRGMLLYQDLIWKFGFKFKVTGRIAIFDAPDYDARIYAYENDILGFFSIPPLSGVGSRYYLILNWKPVRGLEFWARVAQTRLHETSGIGSGLEAIEGNTRTELKLQMRLSF